MANWYVWSGAAGSGTGANWTNAYTTLGAAATAKAAGDVFFVAHDHAETAGSAKTITFAGTEALPNKVYCVDRAGSVPPVAADLRTTATITTTGAFGITLAGSCIECYGIIFNCGTGATSATISISNTASRTTRLVNCSLRLLTTATASRITVPSVASGATLVVLENTTVQFGNVSQLMQSSGRVIWRNTPTAILGATIPTALLGFNGVGASWFVEGVDLSAAASGKTIFLATAATGPNLATLKDCKLGASVSIVASPTLSPGGLEVSMIRCDSADTNYRTEKYTYSGTLTTETTIVMSGGASDGTTPISWKIVTSANSHWPFWCPPISVWNETVDTPITVTIEGVWGGGAVPLNTEIWIDVEYLGTSGFPLGSEATSGNANSLVTGTSVSAGSGTWGGSTTTFAMSATFTPAEKGPLTIVVKAAKPSSTFYIDPKPFIT